MKNIRWASIGCGSVCEVKSLPAMYKLEGSEVAGVYARNQAHASDFVHRHGLPKVYKSADELLHDDAVDIVYIATPPHVHAMYTKAALDAGKHVYVEKPMALNFADSLEMHEYAESRHRKLFVAHYRRGLPYFNFVKELLHQGAVGKLLSVKLDQYKEASVAEIEGVNLPWRLQSEFSGGGHFYDLAPHAVDIIAFIAGADYREVNGFATNMGGLYNVEDTVVSSFLLQNGVCGTAQWSFVTSPASAQDSITFIGTEGYLQCSIFSFQPIVLHNMDGKQEFTTDHPEHIQMPLVQSIIDDLNGRGTCAATSATALTTAWAMDKMLGKL